MDSLEATARSLGLELDDEALVDYREIVADSLTVFGQMKGLPAVQSTTPDQSSNRCSGGTRKTVHEPTRNPFNAFISRCQVEEVSVGPLVGYDIGLKDNIPVAEVEMTAGSALLRSFRPTVDATVVTRLLDVGGTVVGKLNMDAFAFTGTGETALDGPVLNPHAPDRLAGGSSGGSAAAVAAGDVDIGLGTDAGGSIRRPAAACGCVGLKPTHGLVPYTGIVPTSPSLDHVGPITRTVEASAVALEALAGPDGVDPRQTTLARDPPAGFRTGSYTDRLDAGEDSLVVGVLEEGFSADSRTNRVVRTAIERLAEREIEVESVSVPLHERAKAIWSGIFLEEATATIRGGAVEYVSTSRTDPHIPEILNRIRTANAADLPPTLTSTLLIGTYLTDEYRGEVSATARGLRGTLTAAYDAALDTVDVLALPTIQHPATPVPDERSVESAARRGTSRSHPGVQNRAPFNATGHPAITVPCGSVDGLPVGVMLVGEHFDEATLFWAARCVELSCSG